MNFTKDDDRHHLHKQGHTSVHKALRMFVAAHSVVKNRMREKGKLLLLVALTRTHARTPGWLPQNVHITKTSAALWWCMLNNCYPVKVAGLRWKQVRTRDKGCVCIAESKVCPVSVKLNPSAANAPLPRKNRPKIAVIQGLLAAIMVTSHAHVIVIAETGGTVSLA